VAIQVPFENRKLNQTRYAKPKRIHSQNIIAEMLSKK
jgi:hypothetical protein